MDAGARIIYTADTLGYLRPCAGCGEGDIGGLARRASLLRNLAAADPRPLILSGPFEFFTDREHFNDISAARIMPVLHAAFDRMPYNAVHISPQSASRMRRMGLPPLKAGIVGPEMDEDPVIQYFRAGNLVAGCVFFPPGRGPKGTPTPDQITAIRAAALTAANGGGMVVGISPWGMQAENTASAALSGYFHILLGSGQGIAVPGQASGTAASPGPLWVRSDRRGRAVTVLDIFSLPEKGAPWLEGIHFTSQLVFLDKEIPEDGETRLLMADLPDDAE